MRFILSLSFVGIFRAIDSVPNVSAIRGWQCPIGAGQVLFSVAVGSEQRIGVDIEFGRALIRKRYPATLVDFSEFYCESVISGFGV